MHRKHQNRYQRDSSFTKASKLAPSTPIPHFTSLDWVRLDESFSKSFACFKKVNS